MNDSLKNNEYQKKVFEIYNKNIEPILKDETPALLVEVELYHNSYTKKNSYDPQRMDFCLHLGNIIILIELDGIQHIGDCKDGLWVASEVKYSEQCLFDIQWQLAGNEIYRISNKTFKDMSEKDIEKFITDFFIFLFKKHKLI